ncbi:MAG: hypothetical protein OEW70_05370 [candidate division WOR-3 bacterium]|nr:hypothetical protein [candidate division WOR-3 bacterium]
MAEIAGIIIIVLVALLLVDRYTQYHREKRWEKVRKLTHRALVSHLSDLITELFIYFTLENHTPMRTVIEGRSRPTNDTIKAINDLIIQLQNITPNTDVEKSTSDVAVEYYNAVRWEINQIR